MWCVPWTPNHVTINTCGCLHLYKRYYPSDGFSKKEREQEKIHASSSLAGKLRWLSICPPSYPENQRTDNLCGVGCAVDTKLNHTNFMWAWAYISRRQFPASFWKRPLQRSHVSSPLSWRKRSMTPCPPSCLENLMIKTLCRVGCAVDKKAIHDAFMWAWISIK